MATEIEGGRPPGVVPELSGGVASGTESRERSRLVFRVAVAVAVIVAVVGLGAFGWATLSEGRGANSAALTHRVQKGEMVVTVTEDGNVASASNVDIKCLVAGGSAILWIIEDGKEVKKGDKLIELESSQLIEQINQQKITYEKARAAVIQAEKDYSVAQISVKEYLEGVYKQQLQTQETQITIAMENLRTAQNTLDHTDRMFRKGYVSQLELEGQQFAVQRAQLELDSARTAKEVLEKFTKVKTMEDLQSKVDTAQAKMQSEKAAFKLEEDRLKRLEVQISQCVINAPQDGMVVYANEASRERYGPSSQSSQIEEGASVRERQNILRLPDLSQMQVKVAVHETKVESLSRGMRARIRIQDRELYGSITSIANQPEPSSFFSASVKEYATIVRIEGETRGLRPGMTAEVEILVAHLKDVITVPVAAVVEQRGEYFAWVKKGEAVERRPLVLGLTDDQFVEVKDGLVERDLVLLNPRAVVPEARTSGGIETKKVDVGEKFGGSSPATPAQGNEKTKAGVGPAGTGRAPGQGGPTEGDSGAGAPGSESGMGGGRGDGPGSGRGSRGGGGPAGRGGGGGPRGGPGGGPGGGMMDMSQLDKDGDGKVSKAEAPEFMQSFFDRVDTNSDGFLDKSEMEAMRSRRSSGGGSRNLMQYDKNGDGKVSKEEAPEMMQGFFDRMDTNGDGAIDKSEIEAARSRMGGGEGGGFGRGPGGP